MAESGRVWKNLYGREAFLFYYAGKCEKEGACGIRAHRNDILTEGGQTLTSHRRAFGEGRTAISDYSTTLAVLMKNSGAWGNSGLRQETPDMLRSYMDAQLKDNLKDCLRIMNELANQYGFPAAACAMEMACARGGINICDASALAASRQLFLSDRISEV